MSSRLFFANTENPMNTSNTNSIEATAFAAGPARDSRFDVKERGAECLNLPDTHPDRDLEFFHRQMNEEINGMGNAARDLADFPDAGWSVRDPESTRLNSSHRYISYA